MKFPLDSYSLLLRYAGTYFAHSKTIFFFHKKIHAGMHLCGDTIKTKLKSFSRRMLYTYMKNSPQDK